MRAFLLKDFVVGVIFLLMLIVVPVLVFNLSQSNNRMQNGYKQDFNMLVDDTLISTNLATHSIELPRVQARAISVWDSNRSEYILEHNSHAQLSLASITKLMTALVALEKFSDTTIIFINSQDINMEGDSGLYVGEEWFLGDLVDVMLVGSLNDAASAIAHILGTEMLKADGETSEVISRRDAHNRFIKEMNKKTKTLGLDQTYFLSETGLDIGRNVSGGYGSANDISILVSYMLREHPSILKNSTSGLFNVYSKTGYLHKVVNTNPFVSITHGLVASKTGYTENAGGNLVIGIEFENEHRFVATVLGSTIDGRFIDMQNIINYIKTYMDFYEIPNQYGG